jgi:hypothetical protein
MSSSCCNAPTRLTQVVNGPPNSLVVCTKCDRLDSELTGVRLKERELPCGCHDECGCVAESRLKYPGPPQGRGRPGRPYD